MAGVSEERLAINEATFRKVNEGIEAGSDDHRMAFACECGRLGCNRLLELSRPEYDAVREHPRRFFGLARPELLDNEGGVGGPDPQPRVRKGRRAGGRAPRP